MHEPYRKRLPHIMPPGETLFITFRLHGTVPYEILLQLQEEHTRLIQEKITEHEPIEIIKKRLESRYFVSFDHYMDQATSGEDWLRTRAVAELVVDSLHFGHNTSYALHAFCIMPNHVHVLLTILREDVPFFTILQRIKTYTSVRANRLLNRVGKPFWQAESYDHVVRNNKSFERIINYILSNPVKAGLVENVADYPYSYCRYE